MCNIRLFLFLLLVTGTSMAADRYINIDTPVEHARVDPANPLLVSGTGRGMFEGNVVVRIEDAAGNLLLQMPTTMKRDDIAAEGEWQISIMLPGSVPESIRLSAYSPSPKEGDPAISSPAIMLTTRPAHGQTGLQEQDWQLGRYLDVSGKMVPILADAKVTVRFMDGKLSGSAGCNRYFGSYSTSDADQISFSSDIGTTMMACVPPVSEQERQYLKLLPAVAAYQLQDGSLRLLNRDHKAVLEYMAVKPLMLEDTHWQAAGINNGRGGVVSSRTTQLATARFKDGTVSGHAGCNTFNASYAVTSSQMSIGPVMATHMFCGEQDGIMDQEQEYLQALSRVRVYELTDSGLKLRDEKGSLQVNFVAEDNAQ